jgi:hypothetical protein
MTIFHVAIIAVCIGIGICVGMFAGYILGQAYMDSARLVGLLAGLILGLTPYPIRGMVWLFERNKRTKK